MIRSRIVNKIHELATQGKSIQDIAIELGIARNTVRKYLRHPELCALPHPRPNRRSKLDPFKEHVKKWIEEEESMLWLSEPVGFQVNVKSMLSNGNIDVFRTNGRGSLAKVSKRDARVSVHNLEEGGEFRFRNVLASPGSGSSRRGRASCL
ncbi:MAG: helix-turn-helix domain-containing protein, partial [Ktedonobacteraceae bacterium]